MPCLAQQSGNDGSSDNAAHAMPGNARTYSPSYYRRCMLKGKVVNETEMALERAISH